MNGPHEPVDPMSPVEVGLDQHLELLRADAPQPSTALVKQIVHVARWQQAIRQPLLAIGALAAAIADGLRLLFGSRTGRS